MLLRFIDYTLLVDNTESLIIEWARLVASQYYKKLLLCYSLNHFKSASDRRNHFSKVEMCQWQSITTDSSLQSPRRPMTSQDVVFSHLRPNLQKRGLPISCDFSSFCLPQIIVLVFELPNGKDNNFFGQTAFHKEELKMFFLRFIRIKLSLKAQSECLTGPCRPSSLTKFLIVL